MNYLMGRLPLLLEIVINGFFVLIYTFQKAKQAPELLSKLPMPLILEHAVWVVPLVLFLSLTANFLKSDGYEDFIRRYVFSLIIFMESVCNQPMPQLVLHSGAEQWRESL